MYRGGQEVVGLTREGRVVYSLIRVFCCAWQGLLGLWVCVGRRRREALSPR